MEIGKMVAYVDSSVVLRVLLREPGPTVAFEGFDELITSDLTDIECKRTLDRIRIQEMLTDEEVALRYTELSSILKSFRIVRLSSQVLTKSRGTFPTVIRTLDAIHLSTAILARDSKAEDDSSTFYFITYDNQQKIAAKALGFFMPEV